MRWLETLKVRGRAWFIRNAHTARAQALLGVISFSESSFFVVPPDPFLAAILMAGSQRWVYYAALTTATSVVGGLFAYLIGALFYDVVGHSIVTFYGLEEEMARAGEWFSANAFWTIFVSAFTPIPFKVFTLGAGVFKISLLEFAVASLLGRGLRYFAIAYFVRVFGGVLGQIIFKYFNILSLIAVVVICVGIFVFVIL